MSRELSLRFNESNKRLDALISAMSRVNPLSVEYEELSKMNHSELQTMQAINNSSLQQLKMHWTTSGDFSHLPAVGIGF